MRVFISYADEDKEIATSIAQSIRSRGHQVFTVPAGANYESKIELAIRSARVFVFLISPHSVERGCYTLTELGMAEKKWKQPAGRVLPVMITPIKHEEIPPYLRAISILLPTGNVPAEVAAAVDAMKSPIWQRAIFPSAAVIVVGLLLCLFLLKADIRSSFVGPYQVHIGPNGGCSAKDDIGQLVVTGKPFSTPPTLATIEPAGVVLLATNECGYYAQFTYVGPRDTKIWGGEYARFEFTGDTTQLST
jgi:hypothetical protein